MLPVLITAYHTTVPLSSRSGFLGPSPIFKMGCVIDLTQEPLLGHTGNDPAYEFLPNRVATPDRDISQCVTPRHGICPHPIVHSGDSWTVCTAMLRTIRRWGSCDPAETPNFLTRGHTARSGPEAEN